MKKMEEREKNRQEKNEKEKIKKMKLREEKNIKNQERIEKNKINLMIQMEKLKDKYEMKKLEEQNRLQELEEKDAFNLKKRKMVIPKIKIKIDKKVFYKKDGRTEQFNLYQERDIGLNKYDNQIDIMPSEEDYDSDNMIIMDGKKKAEKDLIEAVEIIKRNNLEEVSNYVKYCK